MLYEIRALLALVITFSLLAPVSAKTDYCHQARPQAYLTHEDMISVAKGIYLVQADHDQVGFEEETPETIEDTRPHALDSTTDVSNDNEETAPVIPNFKSEVRRITRGRRNPDQVTIESSVAFRKTQAFTVLESLSGTTETNFSLNFASIYTDKIVTSFNDFNAHNDEDFWENSTSGRTPLNKQCQVNMTFESGKTYLLFKGLDHPKAAELIISTDDKWLAYIRKLIATMNK